MFIIHYCCCLQLSCTYRSVKYILLKLLLKIMDLSSSQIIYVLSVSILMLYIILSRVQYWKSTQEFDAFTDIVIYCIKNCICLLAYYKEHISSPQSFLVRSVLLNILVFCVLMFVLHVFVLCLLCQILHVSLNYPYLIGPFGLKIVSDGA